jgi:hypothetical protein
MPTTLDLKCSISLLIIYFFKSGNQESNGSILVSTKAGQNNGRSIAKAVPVLEYSTCS